MLWIISAIIISYLIGSIPTAFIAGRVLKGIDIRKHGSGNIGATNAFRVLGAGWGIVVLLLDCLKGALPVAFLADICLAHAAVAPNTLRMVLGVSAILGHTFTVFLSFKGGKGIATTLGVLIGLALRIPGFGLVLGCVIATWALVFAFSRIVSLASIIASVLFPCYVILLRQPILLIVTSIILTAFIIVRHLPNIRRLRQGQEKPLFGKKHNPA
jgi:acyl phosphate:glycerol-3-phosphate acyltransferase